MKTRLRVEVTLTIAALAVLTLHAACAHPRHAAVVADTALYETLNAVHQTEQVALHSGLAGWDLAKSQAFNKKLLPAVEAGRQFNAVLSAWQPGAPVPDQVKQAVTSLGNALAAVTADFPEGATKSMLLGNIGKAQQIALNALALILEVKR